jgi:hypothetical protein
LVQLFQLFRLHQDVEILAPPLRAILQSHIGEGDTHRVKLNSHFTAFFAHKMVSGDKAWSALQLALTIVI